MEHHTDKQRCKQFAEPLLQGLHCLPVVDCFHCEQIWKEKACEILSQEVMSLSIIISWGKKKKKKKKAFDQELTNICLRSEEGGCDHVMATTN